MSTIYDPSNGGVNSSKGAMIQQICTHGLLKDWDV